MLFTRTKLEGAFIIDIKKLEDDRGFFARSFCQKEFEEYGLNANIVQANLSFNQAKGTLRGMHMQLSPFSEVKYVRCTRGAIYDVIVDLREGSDTFRQWIGVELRAEDYRMLCVPEGFAHGFITLEDNTDVAYNVTQFYTPSAERGYRWDDPAFGIVWPFNPVVVSEKDQAHPLFSFQNSSLITE